ncbi:NupC/NupG family nucleoside CNT transporter [Desulfoluna spongiiphila]|uniref:Concentrative nucleoside transporter, CNT family n=1 Tax=Desulfoluna spongiiphila TaxID=419481 RepID=A0A1G5IQQ3_9BACT|nr:nucleoside transporter C-terminal domain-containing protein [Desulfoluna spongiiphila]SCY78307.1 concentrative nucleoside transporter, CNT family [Desulfoluna spongiiphila]
MLQSVFGVVVLTAMAWGMSEKRRVPQARNILIGLGLQAALAFFLLKWAVFRDVFISLNGVVLALEEATQAGTGFVFGYLGGGPLPFESSVPGADFILAFRALPILLVMSALSALLFYWGILPKVVQGFSWLLARSMGVGGALGVGAAANVFVGMVEAPLLIRPYLAQLTRSELFAVMTCGMATVAGTVLVLYAGFVGTILPGALGHILTASLISVPAALMVARLMVPETETVTSGTLDPQQSASSSMDAINRGTLAGLTLFLNVTAMLLVLIALVHIVNQAMGLLPDLGGDPLTLQRILGWLMAPLVWLMGIPWAEARVAGGLMGVKTVLNELLAYIQLANLPEGTLSSRSQLIMTYALCGFANFGSLGIMLGGLNAMVPERREEIVGLGLKSIVSGTLATLMTGAMVGVMMP